MIILRHAAVIVLISLGIFTERAFGADSLVGYWSFDEGSRDTVFDQTGNGHDGTLVGGTWTSGYNGSALSYDGSSDFVTVPDHADLNFGAGEWALSMWFSSSMSDLAIPAMVAKGSVPDSGTPGYKMELVRTQVRIQVYDGTTNLPPTSPDILNDGQWHHLVGQRNNASGNIELYVDGVLADTRAMTSFGSTDCASDLLFGKQDNGYYFAGLLDEIKLFNRALDTAAVRNLFTEFDSSRAADRLVGHWSFDEGAGDTLFDSAVNGYDGAITSATWDSGIAGGCLAFDGTDDIVSIPHDTVLHDGFVSISVWAVSDLDSSPVNAKRIITKGFDVGSIDLMQDGRIRAVRWIDGYWQEVFIPAYAWRAGEWMHIVQTYENGYLKIYLNGVCRDSLYRTGDFGTGTDPVDIGGFSAEPDSDYWWDGKIDEVRIFNTGLSVYDVRNLYDEHAPPADSLIAHWTFDDGSDTILTDIGTYGNHGTVKDAAWTDGVAGGALSFNGADSGYVNVGPLGDLGRLSNTCTVTGWVNWTNTGAWQAVFGGFDGDMQLGFYVNRRGDDLTSEIGDVVCYLRSEDGKAVGGGTVGMSYNDGEWHHFAWVYRDASSNLLELYVDGKPVPISMFIATSPLVFDNYAHDMLLGAYNYAGNPERFFTGSLDEFRVYSVALSADEIQGLYNAYNPGPDTVTVTVPDTGSYELPGMGLDLDFIDLEGTDTVTVVQHDSLPDIRRGQRCLGRMYGIHKGAGITSFRARITISFTEEDFIGSGVCCKESLYCVRYNDVYGIWEPFASIIDTLRNTVSCLTEKFSVWTIAGMCRGIGCPPCTLQVVSVPPETAYAGSLYTYEPECIGGLYGSLVTGPDNMVLDDSILMWTPDAGDTGTYSIQLAFCGICEQATQDFTVTVLSGIPDGISGTDMPVRTLLTGENPVRNTLGCIRLAQREHLRIYLVSTDTKDEYRITDRIWPAGRHEFKVPDGITGGIYYLLSEQSGVRSIRKILVLN